MTETKLPHGPQHILRTLFLISVAFAVIIFAHALLVGRAPAEIIANIWELVLLCPALSGFFWLTSMAVSHSQAQRLQPKMSEDAARSARRVTRVGGRFIVGISAVGVLIQVAWISGMFGLPQALDLDPDIVMRAVFLMIGALVLYFGNIVPKTPLPAGSRASPAAHHQGSRLLGWILVIHGAAICLGALLLDADLIGPAWSAIVGSMLLTGFIAAAGPHLLHALKSRRAS